MLSTLKQNLEYNLPALWLKPAKCSVCSNQFVMKAKNARRPLILKCFHPVCDACCMKNRLTVMICNVCKETTRLDRNHLIRESLETHYYINGQLNYIEYSLSYDVNMINTFQAKGKPNESNNTLLAQECNECSVELTNSFCIQCRVPYCPKCFDKVHRHGKIFQQHCLSQLDKRGNFNFRIEDKRCRRHNNYVNRFCSDCKLAVCVNCAMEGHARHRVTSILEENQRVLSQISSLIETVKAAKEANKQAQKVSVHG